MIFMIALVSISLSVISMAGQGNDGELNRIHSSAGLPQETDSFSAVESFDIDNDGSDEIILGGAGFVNGDIRTEGIRIYGYDAASGVWEPFGSGLPGDGSSVYYGALGMGDVNDDGNVDIVGPIPSRWYDVDTSQNGLDIYIGDGRGGFQFHHKISLLDSQLGSSNEVEVADLDGDGFSDLIASTYSGVKVFFGDGSATRWIDGSPPSVRTVEISGIGLGDLNGDGLLDIVGTPGQGSSDVEVYIQGNLRTWRDVPFKETDAGYGVKVRDLDLDGDDDIIYGTRTEGIKVWLCDGSVGLTSISVTDGSDGLPFDSGDWDQIELDDINSDGKPDMIAARNSGPLIHCFINDLPGGWYEIFTGNDELEVGGDAYGANFGDWNGDDQPDIAGCSWDHGVNAWIIPGSDSSRPVAIAGNDRTVNIDETVELDGSASYDPDGEVMEWDWSCTSHPSISISDKDSPTSSFVPEEAGVYSISLVVRDDDGEESLPSTVLITALDPDRNIKPVADAGTPQDVKVGDLVELDGSGSYDTDGIITDWIWTIVSGSGTTLQDADTPYPTLTPATAGDLVIGLVVTDDDGESSDRDSVTIEVSLELYFPKIGPFLYDTGDPIAGATVKLKKDGNVMSKKTDGNGFATFNEGMARGEYSCTLLMNEEEVIGPFKVTIGVGGAVSYQNGAVPVLKTDRENGDFPVMMIVGIIAAVLIIGTAIFIFARRSGGSEVTEEEAVQVIRNVESYQCQTCGGELSFLTDFNMYYCKQCDSYLDQ
jgi:hypothetical protein